jgi:hypothetical protein
MLNGPPIEHRLGKDRLLYGGSTGKLALIAKGAKGKSQIPVRRQFRLEPQVRLH